MNPQVFIIPAIVAIGGILCFFLLPLPLGIRVAVMVSDLVVAGILGVILARRSL